MENAQISFLTSLLAGKPSGQIATGPDALFSADTNDADKNAQGFFSFIEGLLKEAQQGGEIISPLAIQPQPGAQPFNADAFRATLEAPAADAATPIEAGIAAPAAEASLLTAAPATAAGPALAAGPTAEASLPGEVTASPVSASADEAPVAEELTLEAQTQISKPATQTQEKAAPAIGLVAASASAKADSETPDAEFILEAPRDGAEEDTDPLLAPRMGEKTPATAANNPLAGPAASLVADTTAGEPQAHSTMTREDRGVEFDRLASSRVEVTTGAAERNVHIHAVRDQIAAAVTARQGDNRLEVRLDPPELGRVTIGFESDGGDIVRAVLSADSPETLQLMRRNADVFQRMLEDQGFTGLDLQFSDHGPQENPAEQANDNTYNFAMTEDEAPAQLAAPAAQVALGRLDRRL